MRAAGGGGAREVRTAGGAGASAPGSESTSAEPSERAGGGRGLQVVTPVVVPQRPAGVVWAGSNVLGDWHLCGVSLALDAGLKRAGWCSGVRIRKHVEPLSVQGGGCPPCQPVLPLEAPSLWSDRFGGSVSIHAGRHRELRMATLPASSQGFQAVCEL